MDPGGHDDDDDDEDEDEDDLVASMSLNSGKIWENCRWEALSTTNPALPSGRFAAIRHGEVIANLGESSQAGEGASHSQVWWRLGRGHDKPRLVGVASHLLSRWYNIK